MRAERSDSEVKHKKGQTRKPVPLILSGHRLRARLDARRVALVAHLESHKSRDLDFAQSAGLALDQLADAHRVLLDEGLFQQADFLVELAQAAFDDLIGNVSGL